MRTVCKGLARGGCEKSGAYSDFKAFSAKFREENGLNKFPLTPYKGSRFNISFFNGQNIYCMEKLIVSFLIFMKFI